MKTLIALLLLAPLAHASNCAGTSTGNIPLIDLGSGFYHGAQGGLYPGGSNEHPNRATALEIAQSIGPLDQEGRPDTAGKYVLISIGMSNATQEFKPFLKQARNDPSRDQRLVVIDGAQGGWVGEKIVDSKINATYWTHIHNRLIKQGVSEAQVVVAWVKTTHNSARWHKKHGAPPYPAYADSLRGTMEDLAHLLHERFPNIRLAYYSTRTYGGYASTLLAPEPDAFEGGFSAKWLIESQINGEPSLNWNPTWGQVLSPFLSWGPYLWADGLSPRSDGLIWECNDFRADDGTHPSEAGKTKVADMLFAFVHSDPSARAWYLRDE